MYGYSFTYCTHNYNGYGCLRIAYTLFTRKNNYNYRLLLHIISLLLLSVNLQHY